MNVYNRIIDKKSLRFLASGAFNTFLGFFLFPILYFLCSSYRIHYVKLLVFCQIICVTSSFLTNKFWVFRSSGNYLAELYKFAAFHFFYFLVTLFVLPFFVTHFSMNPVIAQLFTSTTIVLTSYIWYNKVAFINQMRL